MKKLIWTLSFVGLGAAVGAGLLSSSATAQAPQQEPAREGPEGMTGQPAEPKPMGTEGARQPVVKEVAEVVTAAVTVKEIDKKNRRVMLTDDKGSRIEAQVPPELTGFDKLKKGDKLNLTYQEAAAVAILPAGTAPATPGAEERTVVGQRPVGGGTAMAREFMVTVPVVKVDAKDSSITVKTGEGKTQEIEVDDPALKQRLPEVKPGDVIQLTFVEAVVTAIEPRK